MSETYRYGTCGYGMKYHLVKVRQDYPIGNTWSLCKLPIDRLSEPATYDNMTECKMCRKVLERQEKQK